MWQPNFDNLEVYELLLKATYKYKVDPSASGEMEDFFRNLLQEYQTDHRDDSAFLSWLDSQLDRYFIVLNKRPQWIQGFDWPISNGLPMLFVGQIDISVKKGEPVSKIFHDDTSFYVFLDSTGAGTMEVILQQF